MNSDLNIKIENDKINENEYLIKDIHNIVLGRFQITEFNESKRRCNIELSYYKEDNYLLLKNSLTGILKGIFKNKNIFKINIKVKYNINVNPFIDSGFILEGILSENEFYNGEYYDQLIMGITRYDFEKASPYSNIYLKGENIRIKNLTPAYAEDVFEYYKRNMMHLEHFEPARDKEFYTLEAQQKILIEGYKQYLNGTNIDMGIFIDENLIGKIKISNIVYGSLRSGIIGYSLDEEYCGRGYMSEALNLVLKYAFEECELHRIEASALVTNEKSRNVLRRCGFKFIGVNEKYLLIDGRWQDHATYYLVKEDFYNKKDSK